MEELLQSQAQSDDEIDPDTARALTDSAAGGGDDDEAAAFRDLMYAAVDESEPAEAQAAKDDLDPREKIAASLSNLADLESRAVDHGKEPELLPFEGQGMFDELKKLRKAVEEKKKEIEQLKMSTDQHTAAAAEIDEQVAAIEAAHQVELSAQDVVQQEERRKTERVLQSMRDTQADVAKQIEDREGTSRAIESSIEELEKSMAELEEQNREADAAATGSNTKADTALEAQTSEASTQTAALKERTAADLALVEQARADLKNLTEELDAARARKSDADKRGEAFDKNLEKKRQAKANTEAQLLALDAQADALRVRHKTNLEQALKTKALIVDMVESRVMLEADVDAAVAAHEKVEAAVTATQEQTWRLEAKVKTFDEEKQRVLRKIATYEEASQQFCFSFNLAFNPGGFGPTGVDETKEAGQKHGP